LLKKQSHPLIAPKRVHQPKNLKRTIEKVAPLDANISVDLNSDRQIENEPR
jgi:hypothetical protein